ncbi:MAG: zf-TFIIB domain-containing protein [Ilumatobacteraceae bacterium]
MKCPTCPESTLVMADRAGIEIDYCPTCRGVWLDRGELDKIIERSAGAAPVAAAATSPAAAATGTPPPYQQPPAQYPQPQGQPQHHSKYHSKYHASPYKKKKSSFLGEIFDF